MEQGGDGSSGLEDVDHLARSPHRTRIVQLFASDDWTRRELYEATGISQPTLGRILGSFQDRGWLARDGDTYSLTLRGQVVASRFVDLLDTFEAVRRLPPEANLDAIVDLGFDPEWLAHVDVGEPDRGSDWYGHLRQVHASIERVGDVREVAPAPLPGVGERLRKPLRDGEMRIESVFPREGFESFVADPENRSTLAALLDTGNADVYLLDRSITAYVARHGERAVFDVPSGDGGPAVRFTTTYPPVLEWVDSTFERFRERATPLTSAELGE